MQYAAESLISPYVPDVVVGMKATSGGSRETAVKVPTTMPDGLAVRRRARDDRDSGRVMTHDLAVLCGVEGLGLASRCVRQPRFSPSLSATTL